MSAGRSAIFWLLNILSASSRLSSLLHSTAFHNYVLRTAEAESGGALNTRVTLQNFALHFSNLGLDLYGLTVYGVGPGANQPMLQVDHVECQACASFRLLRRQWNLDNVSIDHPVVNLIVDAQGQDQHSHTAVEQQQFEHEPV